MTVGVCELDLPGAHSVAKKTGKTSNARNQDRHKRPRESFHMDADLHRAFVGYVDSHPEGADKTGVLVAALKAYLAAKGVWPPPQTPPAAGRE